MGQTTSLALVRQPVKENENSEIKPTILRLKIDSERRSWVNTKASCFFYIFVCLCCIFCLIVNILVNIFYCHYNEFRSKSL